MRPLMTSRLTNKDKAYLGSLIGRSMICFIAGLIAVDVGWPWVGGGIVLMSFGVFILSTWIYFFHD